MTRSPSEYYVRYLLSHNPAASDAELYELCDSYRFYNVSTGYIRALRSEMQPIPDRARLMTPGPEELKWLRRHRILVIWTEPDVRKQVTRILEHSRLREFVESMIVAGYEALEMVKFLDDFTPQGLKAYEHYVFNLGLLSSTELDTFLASKSPIYRALWHNRSHDAKELVLHLNGVAPYQATVESAGRRVINMINSRLFMLASEMPSLDDSTLLRNYTMALRAAAAVVGTGDDAASELKKVLDSIVFDTDTDGIRSFEELKRGAATRPGRGGTPEEDAV